MKPIGVFTFSVANFAVLVTALLWVLRPSTIQFFFARRSRIRKEMLTSVMSLRKARRQMNINRTSAEQMPQEIVSRRKAIADQCCIECEQLLVDAKRKAEYLIESAERSSREEEKRAQQRVRQAILTKAFVLAEKQLAPAVTNEARERALARALTDLKHAAVQAVSRNKASGRIV